MTPEQLVRTIRQLRRLKPAGNPVAHHVSSSQHSIKNTVLRGPNNQMMGAQNQNQPGLTKNIRALGNARGPGNAGGMITVDNYFDRVLVLNMNRRLDRWYNMVRRLDEQGITNYERFVAVDGYSSPYKEQWEEYAKRPFNQYDRKYARKAIRSPGVWGILNSMRRMLLTAKERKYKRILVLQDDAMFHHNFRTLFSEKVKKIPQNWKLLFLGVTQYNYARGMLDAKVYYHPGGMADGAFAMAFDHTVYDFIIREIERFVLPFDSGASMAAQRRFLRECLVLHPFLIIADTTESDCRGERKTEEFSKAVKWDYPKFEEYKTLTENPLISIIMVSQNSADFVQDSINSLLEQTHRNIEILVFDNASTDTTIEKIRELKSSKIKLYQSPIVLPTAVLYNTGILIARGEAFGFHSPQSCSNEDRYAEQIEALKYVNGVVITTHHSSSTEQSGFSTEQSGFSTEQPDYHSALVSKRVQMEIGYLDNMLDINDAIYEYVMKIIRLKYPNAKLPNILSFPHALVNQEQSVNPPHKDEIDTYHAWFVEQTDTTYRAFPAKKSPPNSFQVDVDLIQQILGKPVLNGS